MNEGVPSGIKPGSLPDANAFSPAPASSKIRRSSLTATSGNYTHKDGEHRFLNGFPHDITANYPCSHPPISARESPIHP
ncbi:hypothetical protein [Dictyobacter arantiisoli]|uniref:hypothetical protein n=1 Tax=Dictyobacter arantiisoli TaxID=2014874 RepID=UPI0011EF6039|nr:hypothetical protein [Dictyobacter arantiisoli]